MKKTFQSFYKRIILLSAIIEVIAISMYFLLPSRIFSPAAPFLVLFFFAITTVLYYLMLKLTDDRFSRFVNMFMILTFVKLFVYIIIIIVYSLLNKRDVFPFVITFFILYIIYTLFEIISFLNDQKKLER
jgi:hypothetical protein